MKKKNCRCGEKKSKVSKYPMGTQNISAGSNTFVDSPDYTDLTDKLNRKANRDTAVRSVATTAGDAIIPGLGTAIGLTDSFSERLKDENGIYKSKGAEYADRLNPLTGIKTLASGDKDAMLSYATWGLAGKSESDKNKESKQKAEVELNHRVQNRKYAGTDSTSFQSAKQFKKGTSEVCKYPDGTNKVTAPSKKTEEQVAREEAIQQLKEKRDRVQKNIVAISERRVKNNEKNYTTERREGHPTYGKKTGNNTCLTGVCSTIAEAGADEGSFKKYDIAKSRSAKIKGDNAEDLRYNPSFVKNAKKNGMTEIPMSQAKEGDVFIRYNEKDKNYHHAGLIKGKVQMSDKGNVAYSETIEDHGNDDAAGMEVGNAQLAKSSKYYRYNGSVDNEDSISARAQKILLGRRRRNRNLDRKEAQPKIKTETPKLSEKSLKEKYAENKGGYLRSKLANPNAMPKDIIQDPKTKLYYIKLSPKKSDIQKTFSENSMKKGSYKTKDKYPEGVSSLLGSFDPSMLSQMGQSGSAGAITGKEDGTKSAMPSGGSFGSAFQSGIQSPYGQAALGLANSFLDSQEDKRKKKRDAGTIPNYPQNFEIGGEVRSGYKKQGMFQNKATGGEGYNVDNTGKALTIGKKLYNNRRSDKDFSKLRVGYTLEGKTELTADQIASMQDKSKLIRVRVGDGKFGDSNSLYRDNVPQPKEQPKRTKFELPKLEAFPDRKDYGDDLPAFNRDYSNIFNRDEELRGKYPALRGVKAENEIDGVTQQQMRDQKYSGAAVNIEESRKRRDELKAKRMGASAPNQNVTAETPTQKTTTTTTPQMKKGGMVRKAKIKSTLQSMKYGMGKVKC